MEVHHEVGADGGVVCRRGDALAGGARGVAGVGPVHLRVVDGVAVFGHLEGVVVDDATDENRPRELRRVELWDDPLDDADAVELVAVARGLHVERLAAL